MKKSEIKETRANILLKLEKVKQQLNPNTYRAYFKKIQEKRIDVVRRIGDELDKIKDGENLTLGKIKKIKTPKTSEPKLITVETMEKFNIFQRIRYNYDLPEDNFKNLYEAILKGISHYQTKNFFKPQFINIFYNIIGMNRIRGITIKTQETETFERFNNAVELIKSGEVAGSEPIDPEQYSLIFNYFDFLGLSPSNVSKGYGKSDKMIFEVEGIEQTRRGAGDCGLNCIKFLHSRGLINCDISGLDYKDFQTIDGIINFIELNMLNVNILLNSFIFKNLNKVDEKIIMVKNENKKCYKLKMADIETVYLNYIDDSCPTIIYDEFNKHFDVLKSLKISDRVYISEYAEVIDEKLGTVIFTPRQMAVNNMTKKNYTEKFIIFDYETVIDFKRSCCMAEYSLSVLVLDNDELEELTKADKESDIEKIKSIRAGRCLTFMGYDCSEKFIEWLKQNHNDIKYTFIGFNNSNFDNFILLKALLKTRLKNELPTTQIFYNGNSLLNFKISGRHDFFDIHKHLMGSLAMNCKSFKINSCSKKSFDHNKAQMLHENGELINFIEGNEELKEYNEHDVLATAVLFCKYRDAIRSVEDTRLYADNLHNIKTVGGLIYKVFQDSKKKKGYNLPKLNFQQYSDLQKFKIAGRVELFNGVQKVEERLVSTDVCSLYPYVMSIHPCYYPCGDIIQTSEYMGDDVIGFYYCDIDQSNLRASNQPKIYAKKTEDENDWGHDEILENYLVSNVIIRLLKKHGCSVVIKSGFYFSDNKKSCDMFDFLLSFMKAKNEQDGFNKNGDSRYNPALRETLKLLMNSLSGKVIEGLHVEKTCDVNSMAEYSKIESQAKTINHIDSVGDKIFITYKIDEEDICEKSQRPIYLGVLIYDYAKAYMYDMSYSRVGLNELLYTDTDASKFRYKRFIEWVEWVESESVIVPHWEEVEAVDERYKTHLIYEENSKVFGSFEDELSGMVGEKYLFYCVQKKSWAYIVDDKSKFRFKGLNGNAVVLSLGEDIWNNKDRLILNQKKAYLYSLSNKSMSVGMNVRNFFEDIYINKVGYVLCSSFRKIVKNCLRNVGLTDEKRFNKMMNSVQVNFSVKRITIK